MIFFTIVFNLRRLQLRMLKFFESQLSGKFFCLLFCWLRAFGLNGSTLTLVMTVTVTLVTECGIVHVTQVLSANTNTNLIFCMFISTSHNAFFQKSLPFHREKS